MKKLSSMTKAVAALSGLLVAMVVSIAVNMGPNHLATAAGLWRIIEITGFLCYVGVIAVDWAEGRSDQNVMSKVWFFSVVVVFTAAYLKGAIWGF